MKRPHDPMRRDADDDRRACIECAHYMPGRCGSHGRAGLGTDLVARALAALPKRCAAFEAAPGDGERRSTPSTGSDRCGWTDPERAAWLADAFENPAGVIEALSIDKETLS